MSIVPKEGAVQWVVEYDGPDMTLTQWAEYIANRAAEWALEMAAELCDTQARLDYDAYDLTGNSYSEGAGDAADGLATKLRALLKGGESDGQ
jgi:hypothetical protein